MSTAALSVSDVSYRYPGKVALQDVAFELHRGSFLALLGPNGAGKTTLFSLLTRLLRLQQGEVTVDGVALRQARAAALQNMGVVFQQSTLDPDLTVAQNLLYHAALHGMNKRTARRIMQQELQRMQLPECIDARVRSLNGGHRRRVEIVRALLHRPRILLLDEPTTGLDLESRDLLNHHVRQLCRENNIAVLWCTHLIDELSTDDELLLLHRGKVRAQGNGQALLQIQGKSTLRELFAHYTQEQV